MRRSVIEATVVTGIVCLAMSCVGAMGLLFHVLGCWACLPAPFCVFVLYVGLAELMEWGWRKKDSENQHD